MLVAQRTRELALMRAVGASRRQVTRRCLIEAFVVGTVAGVTGLVAGIGIGAGLRSLMGTLGAQPSRTGRWSSRRARSRAPSWSASSSPCWRPGCPAAGPRRSRRSPR
ncbi:FtsX-like permease family protein [Streptomyces sp. SLBN-31]|uniref:FtsX-like permease family protein n=1 Tax=Streptomyces sp. SLBN-31 TaxID=2768444 RepID=UPI0037D99815